MVPYLHSFDNNSGISNNIQNGGLILDIDKKQFLCGVTDGSGTYIIDKNNGEISKIEDIMWFSNVYNKYIFYSNQKYGNKMYRLDIETYRSEKFLDVPCYQLTIFDNDIFYINELDKKLYSYNLTNNSSNKIIDSQINSFIINAGKIIYNNQNEIALCTTSGRDREVLVNACALRLIFLNNALAFADKKNNYMLTTINIHTGQKYTYEDISTINYNSDGRYIYATNINNGSSIYRIDEDNKACFRIFGDSADYLHIIKDELYFINNKQWNKMVLSGGQASQLLLST
jgi:hypothetical protein